MLCDFTVYNSPIHFLQFSQKISCKKPFQVDFENGDNYDYDRIARWKKFANPIKHCFYNVIPICPTSFTNLTTQPSLTFD